jgi:probable F420-dependent oxidoreductase
MQERGLWLDEVLPLLRRLWTEDGVSHHGRLFNFDGLSVQPKPQQQPLDLWLGGTAKSALRRCGEIGDGWLPSLLTPAEAEAGRQTIEAHAAAAGREIESEHFGVSLGYAVSEYSERQLAQVARRRPGMDPAELIPMGLQGLKRRLEELIDVGFSKFVVRPAEQHDLRALADAVLPLQT